MFKVVLCISIDRSIFFDVEAIESIGLGNYSQSVRWSKRPASQCVRRLVKASDVIGQSVRCDWSMCPRSLVNASGTNDVVIRLSDLINYINWCQVEVKNICFNTADGQWLIGPARPASPMFVAHRPWRTSTADALTFYRGRFDFLLGCFDFLPRTLWLSRRTLWPSHRTLWPGHFSDRTLWPTPA